MNEQKIIATVGESQITETHLNELKKNLDPKKAAQFDNPEGTKVLLDELVNQELFYLDALDQNYAEDPEFLAEMEKVKANVLVQYSIKKLMGSIVVTEEDLKAYFDQNPEQFQSGEQVKASHILVSSEEEALKIQQEIQNGLSFEEAAKKYSTCPSKEQGGDLGSFSRGRMVPEFENAAFSMNVGEVSAPVKTQFGYHLIQLVDHQSSAVQAFDTIKDQLNQFLINQQVEKVLSEKLNDVKKAHPVKIFL